MDVRCETGIGIAVLNDVIIVGGGTVGLVLALALAQQTSLSIMILEAQSLEAIENKNPDACLRVSAITLASERIFETLQVWSMLAKNRLSPFKQIQVWDAINQSEIAFESAAIAQPVLGHIIENHLIRDVLLEKIKQYPHIEYRSGVKLSALHEIEKGMELITEEGQHFKTKLVVGADGAASRLRAEAGITVQKEDYEQTAIITTVETTLTHQQIARQIFLKTGPLAFLPLADSHFSSIVWSLPVDEAKTVMALEGDAFKDALNSVDQNNLGWQASLGEVTAVANRYAFPLQSQEATQYVKPHVALVGDAAHTVHPLAGQGVNMGLLDAASLAEVIVDAVKLRRDFSHLTSLRRYERWRRADNLALLKGIALIKNLFESDQKIIQTLRGAGLNATHRLQWIKNIFTRHAIGDRRGLPKMALKSYTLSPLQYQ